MTDESNFYVTYSVTNNCVYKYYGKVTLLRHFFLKLIIQFCTPAERGRKQESELVRKRELKSKKEEEDKINVLC